MHGWFVEIQARYVTKTIREQTLPKTFSAIESTDILRITEHVKGIENIYRLGNKESGTIRKEVVVRADAILKHAQEVAKEYSV